MGRIAKILGFIRTTSFGAQASDVKVDAGGGDIILAPHFGSPGEDAHPLPGDYSATVETPRGGGAVSVGYVDPKNEQTAQPGERRTYARNEQGQRVCQVWLKSDGTILIENGVASTTMAPDGTVTTTNDNVTLELTALGAGSIVNSAGFLELEAGGDVVANGAKITTGGDVITAAGISLDNHTHAQGSDSAGNTQAETEAPTA